MLKSTRTSVMINGLVCLGKLMNVMDKWLVQESLLPMVEKIQSREPGVLMAMLGIYDEVRFILEKILFFRLFYLVFSVVIDLEKIVFFFNGLLMCCCFDDTGVPHQKVWV